jgi:hypothetical protein
MVNLNIDNLGQQLFFNYWWPQLSIGYHCRQLSEIKIFLKFLFKIFILFLFKICYSRKYRKPEGISAYIFMAHNHRSCEPRQRLPPLNQQSLVTRTALTSSAASAEAPSRAPILYALTGTGGSAKSTHEGYSTALKHFNAFLLTKQIEKFEDISKMSAGESIICSVELFQEFGTYLSFTARDLRSNEYLMVGSALQYLSGVKISCMKLYPGNDIWRHHDRTDGWYHDLRNGLTKHISNRCIVAGLPISEKAKPIGRTLLRKIADYLLRQNTVESIEKCFTLVMTFAAVGRAEEAAHSSWNHCNWDFDQENVFLDWPEEKTSKYKLMTFVCDRQYFEIDFYFTLACYFIVGAGTRHYNSNLQPSSNWMIPHLAGLAVPNKAITQILKDIISSGTIEEMCGDITGTSLRIGAANVMANHRTTDLTHLILRGGWDFSGLCNCFEYLLHLRETINIGGRALAGWPDSRKPCYPPRCVFNKELDEDETVSVRNLMESLFQPSKKIITDLKPLVECMFASLLQNLDSFVTSYGMSHRIVRTLVEKSRSFGIDFDLLQEWGRKVKEDWEYRNLPNQFDDIGSFTTAIHNEMVELKKTNKSLQLIIEEQRKQNKQILDIVRSIQSRFMNSDTPILMSQKKRRQSDVDTAETIEQQEQSAVMSSSAETQLDSNSTLLFNRTFSTFRPYKLEKNVSMRHIFYDWYCFSLDSASKWQSGDLRERTRVSRVVMHMFSFADEETKLFLSGKQPEKENSAWKSWSENLRSIAENLEKSTMSALEEEEKKLLPEGKKVRLKKTTYTAVDGRLQQLEENKKKTSSADTAKVTTFFPQIARRK